MFSAKRDLNNKLGYFDRFVRAEIFNLLKNHWNNNLNESSSLTGICSKERGQQCVFTSNSNWIFIRAGKFSDDVPLKVSSHAKICHLIESELSITIWLQPVGLNHWGPLKIWNTRQILRVRLRGHLVMHSVNPPYGRSLKAGVNMNLSEI